MNRTGEMNDTFEMNRLRVMNSTNELNYGMR